MRKHPKNGLDLVHVGLAETLKRLTHIEASVRRLEGIVLESLPSAARAKFMDEIVEGESELERQLEEGKEDR